MTDESSSDVNEEMRKAAFRAAPTPSIAGTINLTKSPNKYVVPDSICRLGRGRGAHRRGMEFHDQTYARPGRQERQELPQVSARQSTRHNT
jgi:hypothetical protein